MSNAKVEAPTAAPTGHERADARANRARVLEAARQSFAERGLRAEVKEIAGLAGVGVGTVYRGFGSKTDLLQAVAEEARRGLDEIFTQAEALPDAPAALRCLMLAGLKHVDEYGWLLQLFLSGQLAPRMPPAFDRHADFQGRLRRLLQRGVEAGAFRAGLDVDVAAIVIQATILARLAPSGGGFPAKTDAAQLTDGVLALLTA